MQAPEGMVFVLRGKGFAAPHGTHYPVSDDSLLLAENVRAWKGCTAIDVGCGSGIQAMNLLFMGAEKVIALDTSEKALEATEKNCIAAGFRNKTEVRKSDLFAACPEKADAVVFNPPYAPSGKKVKYMDLDGGERGREILDRFLAEMPSHLNEGGACWFLQTDLNGYAETEKKLRAMGMAFETVARKKLFFEELAVYRCWKKHGKHRKTRVFNG